MTAAQPLGVDVDALLMDILRPAVPDGVTVVEFLPTDYTDHYPIVRAFRPPSAGAAVDPRWLDLARAEVDVFDDDRTDAFHLALICRGALFDAWLSQRTYTNGSVSSYDESSAPAELRLPSAPQGQTRVQASYLLGICPP